MSTSATRLTSCADVTGGGPGTGDGPRCFSPFSGSPDSLGDVDVEADGGLLVEES